MSGFPWTASYIKSGVQDLTSENWSAGELEMWSYEVVHGLAWASLRRMVGPWVLEDGSYTADVVLGAVPGFPAMVTRPLPGQDLSLAVLHIQDLLTTPAPMSPLPAKKELVFH